MAFTASDCERCCSLRRFATFQFGKYHRAVARMKWFDKIFGSSGSAPYRYDEGDEYPGYNGPRQSSGPWNGPPIFEVAFHHISSLKPLIANFILFFGDMTHTTICYRLWYR